MNKNQSRRNHSRRKPPIAQFAACLASAYRCQTSRAFTVPSRHPSSTHYKQSVRGSGRIRGRQQVGSLCADTSHSDAASSEQQQNTSPANAFGWKVGNVYDELDALRREITLSNAEQHLRQVEDRERLDTFAANRRPIHRDVRRFVLAPLVLSVFLAIMSKSQHASTLCRIFTGFFDLHLVTIVVLAPMILLLAKQKSMPPPPPPPSELTGLDPEYYRFVVTNWEDPKTSCRDHVLCLLENWTSAVVGPAILACMYIFLPIRKSATGVKLGVAASQLVTRLGAIAALYQYPKLLYQLRRRHQPRPMDRYTMRLQQLVWLALSLAPIGIASDLSKVWSQLPAKLVASLMSLGLIPYAKHRLVRGTQARPLTFRAALAQRLAFTALTGTQLTAVLTLGSMLLNRWRTWTPPTAASYKVLVLLAGMVVSILLAGPVGHLVAIRKLFRINYTHDISLANDYDTMTHYLNDPVERQKRFKWRYRLEWREPERIMETLSNWKGGFSYWLLFEGGVEDQLRKEFRAKQKNAAYRQGLTVLQRVEQEMKENPDAPKPDRTKWKKQAMEKEALKHEADYKSGTYEDPLGVAVQQTFGIGLGYQFDHTSDLKDGERPSARRLQARAAKSAIKRAQEIFDAQAVQEELDSLSNTEERDLKKAESRRATEAELSYIASALADLIPTDLVLKNTDRQTKIQQFRRSYKKSSSHEIIVDSPGDASASIQSLFGRTKDSEQSDEEFVEAWLRRQQEEEDEDDSTVLV